MQLKTPPTALPQAESVVAEAESQPARKRRGFAMPIFTLFLLGGAAYVAYSGIASRHDTQADLTKRAAARAVPTVTASPPVAQQASGTIELPGRLEAFVEAHIFARVPGYIASRNVDIGSKVKSGELLAEIDAPDLDQQLFQAQSDLSNAEANAALAEVTNERYQQLLPNSYVTQQAADEKLSDVKAKRALVQAAQANVDRLKALSGYKRIVAPFDGTVTTRNTDVGALINSGSADGSELFVVSDTHKLRLYVNVPQAYVTRVGPGTNASLSVPEHPGKSYTAVVKASAGAVQPSSGTTRMQLIVDNENGELLPGAYANVKLDVGSKAEILSIPSSALIFDKAGLRVATVGADNKVVMKTIKISRDLGKSIEVASGLLADDRVIETPPDDVDEGDIVNVKNNESDVATQPKAGDKG